MFLRAADTSGDFPTCLGPGIDLSRSWTSPATQSMEGSPSSHGPGPPGQPRLLRPCIILDSYPPLVPGEEPRRSWTSFITTRHGEHGSCNKFIRKAGAASQRKQNGRQPPVSSREIHQTLA